MSQIINLFFIIAGAITVVVGLVKFSETPVFFLAIPIGIALVVFAYREDQRREKRIADNRHAEIAKETLIYSIFLSGRWPQNEKMREE